MRKFWSAVGIPSLARWGVHLVLKSEFSMRVSGGIRNLRAWTVKCEFEAPSNTVNHVMEA